MEYHTSEVKSGVFITVALGLLIAGILVVGGWWDRLTHEYEYYAAYFHDIQLLKDRAVVTLAGRRVGEVCAIRAGEGRTNETEALVVVKVQKGVRVDPDAALVLSQDGILGDKYIAIRHGRGEQPSVRGGPDSEHPTLLAEGQSPPGLQELMDKAAATLDELRPTLKSLQAFTGDAQSGNNVTSLLADARKLLQDLDLAVGGIHGLVGDNRDTVRQAVSNMAGLTDKLNRKIDEIVDNLNQLLKNPSHILSENDRNIFETIHNLKETTYHLTQFAKKVEADPSTLVFGSKPVEESRARRDETEWRLQGRTGPYLQETRGK